MKCMVVQFYLNTMLLHVWYLSVAPVVALPVSAHYAADFVSAGVICKVANVLYCVTCTSHSCNFITLPCNLQLVIIRKVIKINKGIVFIRKITTRTIIMMIMVIVVKIMSYLLYNRSAQSLLADIRTSTPNVHLRRNAFYKSHRCWYRVHCKVIEVAEIQNIRNAYKHNKKAC